MCVCVGGGGAGWSVELTGMVDATVIFEVESWFVEVARIVKDVKDENPPPETLKNENTAAGARHWKSRRLPFEPSEYRGRGRTFVGSGVTVAWGIVGLCCSVLVVDIDATCDGRHMCRFMTVFSCVHPHHQQSNLLIGLQIVNVQHVDAIAELQQTSSANEIGFPQLWLHSQTHVRTSARNLSESPDKVGATSGRIARSWEDFLRFSAQSIESQSECTNGLSESSHVQSFTVALCRSRSKRSYCLACSRWACHPAKRLHMHR